MAERRLIKLYSPGLAGRLAIATGVLVTLAVGSMYVFGVSALRGLAEGDALTRVKLGVAAAREGLRQSGEDVLTATRILGERPPLQRLLSGGVRETLQPYLARYCSSTALDACGVVQGSEWLARTSSEIDWERVLAAAAEQGERFLVTGATEDTAMLGAQAPVLEQSGVTVVALRRMNAGFAARLSERAGVPVTIVDYASFRPGEGPLAVLNTDALSRNEPVAAYIRVHDAYAAAMPVATVAGETVALLQAELPAASVTGPVDRLVGRMLLVAIVIALLATASSVFIGRYWISAVELLTDAARRLGSGDLTTSFPTGGGKELAILGNTMETMRRNLVDVTAELRRRERQAQAVLGGIVEGVYAVDEERRIRFLNPQAERLLKISSHDALGMFCGDVLKPQRDAQGRRPCEYACPILEARRVGSGRAVEQVVARAGRGRAAGRDRERGTRRRRRPAGAGASRRDRARGRAPHARHGARQHLARVPHSARRAAGVDRALTRRRRHDDARRTARARRDAAARHATIDLAHRQPARERADRGRPARHPAPRRRAGRGRGRRARADRAADRAARSAHRGAAREATCRSSAAIRSV